MDRNLGAYELKTKLSQHGFNVTAHDNVFDPQERDPWIFYWAGKKGYIMITADLSFKALFTHQAAIALGRTAVFSFTGNTFNSDARAAAFLRAKPKILRMLKKQPLPFIATIWLNGDVHLDTANPTPSRKKVHPKDWESYERVCRAEGIEPESKVASPAQVPESAVGSTERQATAKNDEEKIDG